MADIDSSSLSAENAAETPENGVKEEGDLAAGTGPDGSTANLEMLVDAAVAAAGVTTSDAGLPPASGDPNNPLTETATESKPGPQSAAPVAGPVAAAQPDVAAAGAAQLHFVNYADVADAVVVERSETFGAQDMAKGTKMDISAEQPATSEFDGSAADQPPPGPGGESGDVLYVNEDDLANVQLNDEDMIHLQDEAGNVTEVLTVSEFRRRLANEQQQQQQAPPPPPQPVAAPPPAHVQATSLQQRHAAAGPRRPDVRQAVHASHAPTFAFGAANSRVAQKRFPSPVQTPQHAAYSVPQPVQGASAAYRADRSPMGTMLNQNTRGVLAKQPRIADEIRLKNVAVPFENVGDTVLVETAADGVDYEYIPLSEEELRQLQESGAITQSGEIRQVLQPAPPQVQPAWQHAQRQPQPGATHFAGRMGSTPDRPQEQGCARTLPYRAGKRQGKPAAPPITAAGRNVSRGGVQLPLAQPPPRRPYYSPRGRTQQQPGQSRQQAPTGGAAGTPWLAAQLRHTQQRPSAAGGHAAAAQWGAEGGQVGPQPSARHTGMSPGPLPAIYDKQMISAPSPPLSMDTSGGHRHCARTGGWGPTRQTRVGPKDIHSLTIAQRQQQRSLNQSGSDANAATPYTAAGVYRVPGPSQFPAATGTSAYIGAGTLPSVRIGAQNSSRGSGAPQGRLRLAGRHSNIVQMGDGRRANSTVYLHGGRVGPNSARVVARVPPADGGNPRVTRGALAGPRIQRKRVVRHTFVIVGDQAAQQSDTCSVLKTEHADQNIDAEEPDNDDRSSHGRGSVKNDQPQENSDADTPGGGGDDRPWHERQQQVLWTLVFDRLGDQKTAVNCMLVCRAWLDCVNKASTLWHHIDLTGRTRQFEGGQIAAINAKRPAKLTLENTALDQVELIELLSTNGRLKDLSLAYQHFSVVRVLKCLKWDLSRLDLTGVAGCNDANFKSLVSDTPRLKRLHELSLASCDIADATVRLIANQFAELRVLSLKGCRQITDQSISLLSASGAVTSKTLKRLDVAHCHHVTPMIYDSLVRLWKYAPRLRVLSELCVSGVPAFQPHECEHLERAMFAQKRTLRVLC